MIHPKIKAVYKNDIACIYIADKINLYGNIYQLVFIGREEDGCIYDTVILPPAKYKQCEHSFTIYHGQDTPEVFYRMYQCTQQEE